MGGAPDASGSIGEIPCGAGANAKAVSASVRGNPIASKMSPAIVSNRASARNVVTEMGGTRMKYGLAKIAPEALTRDAHGLRCARAARSRACAASKTQLGSSDVKAKELYVGLKRPSAEAVGHTR